MATAKTLSPQKWRMWRQGTFGLGNADLAGIQRGPDPINFTDEDKALVKQICLFTYHYTVKHKK